MKECLQLLRLFFYHLDIVKVADFEGNHKQPLESTTEATGRPIARRIGMRPFDQNRYRPPDMANQVLVLPLPQVGGRLPPQYSRRSTFFSSMFVFEGPSVDEFGLG